MASWTYTLVPLCSNGFVDLVEQTVPDIHEALAQQMLGKGCAWLVRVERDHEGWYEEPLGIRCRAVTT